MTEIGSPKEDTPSTYGQNEGIIPTGPIDLDSSIPSSPKNDESMTATQSNVDSEKTETKRKLTSFVWNHFKKQKINGVDKAVCNYCQKILGGSSKNGTTHLRDHFNICSLRKHRDIKQSILNPSKKKDGSTSLAAHNFDQECSRHKLAKMIVLHEYPLNMVEHHGFRDFVNSLQPFFKNVSRSTIRRDILKIYENEKTKTKNSISDNCSRVAITTDMWTSNNQKRGYMVVTAHYIDDSWNLHNRIIRFIYVPAPHTAKLLAKVLMECLVEWSLERKLSTLTLDKCTVNIAMMDQMKEKLRNASLLMKGELVHMKCSAHILNLIVQQGLGAIQGAIETIRESVVFWTDVFSRLIHTEKNYKKEPSERDWLLAKVMCEKLKLFYHVTEMFSGTKYPTTNLFFSKICDIWLLLKECLKSSYDEIRIMASNMMDKFEQYWTSIHGILAIATVMDPRFKMKLIEYYFPKIYVGEYQNEVERIRMLCYDLVKEYKPNDGKENLPDPLSNASGVGGDSDGCVDPLAGYDLFVSSTSKVDTFKSELEFYLEEAVLPRSEEFDILAWWKTNGLKYPTLQQVARDVLAIPVSTVASESAFSTSGRHVTPCRNRLHPSMLEALVCTQDWLWDEKLDASQNEISHSTFFDDVEDDEAGPSFVDFDS
ncbi:zinc finger BED domain-containing protein RICESLEEPER 2-like [Humulus lupulus]|uniref:zinc finger BED domain-containing protein RICESLEEPER 2-like n=1 Tax=Humulus lupulus TaxID=3486 RepID=UPI002B405D2C|nr:zinc finger BED domain-containing protein RICESLEEPER 2-like [Humulus lupulus]